MALAIFTRTCGKNSSGASKIFIAEKAIATAFTITAGEISAVTGTTPFMRIDIEQDSLQWKEELTRVGLNNQMVKNTIDFVIAPPSKDTNTQLKAQQDGSPCGFFAIVIDGNAKCWLVGHNDVDIRERPLRLGKQTHDTGKGLNVAEGNVVAVTLENECSAFALPFDSATTATILAGTATFCKWS